MLKLLKKLDLKDIMFALICFILILGQVWLELKMPDYMSKITRLVQTEGSQMTEILQNGGFMLLCAVGSLISTVIVGYIVANVSSGFSKRLRKELFDKVENLSISEIKKFSTSSLITRTTNDITHIQMLIVMGMQLMIKAPITAIWAITKILNKSWQWSLATTIAVIIIFIMISILMSIVIPRFKKVQKLIDKVNGVTRENLNGIRVVRAFNAEQYQEKKFEDVNNELTNMQLFNQRAFSFLSPVMYLVMYFLTLSIYVIGANLIKEAGIMDKLTIFGDMVVFSSYAMQVIMSFLMLAMIFMMLPRAQVSASRINEVLDEDISVKDGKKDDETLEKGTVEFKNVSFKYPDGEENVIENISFKVTKGQTVAFIGSTGSGKSTLINLIPRFYDVTEGEILVDNINVKDYKLNTLYDKLGYISQKAFIFNDSLKNNISYGKKSGKEINDEDIKKALEVAQAEFVSQLEKGLDTEMAQGGTNVSGGQKQRLSIARAIARDPEIYIFDDSFSALDYKTDSKLRKALKEHTKDATILIVAQRIGTILNANKILVLDEGKIVGEGTHKELLKTCEVYKQIALSQLSKEELENG